MKPSPATALGEPEAERADYRGVVLGDRLRQALVRLNPDLPPEALEAAFRKGTRADGPTLVARNHAVHGVEPVEFATLEWIDWFNNRRLLEPIGNVPPVEFEEMYYQSQEAPARVAGLK